MYKPGIFDDFIWTGSIYNAPWCSDSIFNTINGHFLNQSVRDFKIWDSLWLCLENCLDHYST